MKLPPERISRLESVEGLHGEGASKDALYLLRSRNFESCERRSVFAIDGVLTELGYALAEERSPPGHDFDKYEGERVDVGPWS